MGMLPDIGYPQTGDTVKAGTYICIQCPHDEPDDQSIVMFDKARKLPDCPVCGKTYWMKI